jgi:hypothetical protein
VIGNTSVLIGTIACDPSLSARHAPNCSLRFSKPMTMSALACSRSRSRLHSRRIVSCCANEGPKVRRSKDKVQRSKGEDVKMSEIKKEVDNQGMRLTDFPTF